ncbi:MULTISPECIES: DUF503 domain-containing protein [Aerococcus]|uniref:DUF503 domain-containing protein n=2 Tax=Aerococcus TaxID=1375 RepID=A0A178HEH9_9LACT|nr:MULTISPECIES: DUF503 domain-containing protein [Aerococcus]KAA9220474.1 DUF503 domain-containing protein [Aerococcus loyolae]KAA9265606.1 DUF503 domain-containing protein [Aerococcus loyolae]MCY3025674.1 DUF503 domain-containing protein [Aerococcus loyolae]MCY3027322.1 DUF503 domain-containing protein [Aerococcus loyolae]MCY3028943.1 DUF503 domain-containing protein [Aerococcus loyolae]
MVLIGLEVTFIIDQAYTLKDKRRIVKSMVERAQQREKMTAAEITDLDLVNQAVVAFGLVSNSYSKSRQRLLNYLDKIEAWYPIEVIHTEWLEA